MTIPTPTLRSLLALLSFLPLLLFVLLSAPAWLSWPFMSEKRQRVMIDVMQKLIEWTRACVRAR